MERIWLIFVFFAVFGVVAFALIRVGKKIKKDESGNFIGFSRELNTDSKRLSGIRFPSLEDFFMWLVVMVLIFTSASVMFFAAIAGLAYRMLKKWDDLYKKKMEREGKKFVVYKY